MFGKVGPGINHSRSELDFLKSLWGLGTDEEEGYRTGPPGYIGWRNSFLGIDSGAPYTFKNTGSAKQVDGTEEGRIEMKRHFSTLSQLKRKRERGREASRLARLV